MAVCTQDYQDVAEHVEEHYGRRYSDTVGERVVEFAIPRIEADLVPLIHQVEARGADEVLPPRQTTTHYHVSLLKWVKRNESVAMKCEGWRFTRLPSSY